MVMYVREGFYAPGAECDHEGCPAGYCRNASGFCSVPPPRAECYSMTAPSQGSAPSPSEPRPIQLGGATKNLSPGSEEEEYYAYSNIDGDYESSEPLPGSAAGGCLYSPIAPQAKSERYDDYENFVIMGMPNCGEGEQMKLGKCVPAPPATERYHFCSGQ